MEFKIFYGAFYGALWSTQYLWSAVACLGEGLSKFPNVPMVPMCVIKKNLTGVRGYESMREGEGADIRCRYDGRRQGGEIRGGRRGI